MGRTHELSKAGDRGVIGGGEGAFGSIAQAVAGILELARPA